MTTNGKASVNSTEIKQSTSIEPSVKGTIKGNPNKIIDNASNTQPPQANMVQTTVKLEEVDQLLSKQLGNMHQDIVNMMLKYMDIGSDLKKLTELVGTYKSVLDQKIEATKKIREQQEIKPPNSEQ